MSLIYVGTLKKKQEWVKFQKMTMQVRKEFIFQHMFQKFKDGIFREK